MIEYLESIGLTDFGIYLTIVCCLFGTASGWLKGSTILKPLDTIPNEATKIKFLNKADWLLGWAMYGFIAGFIVSVLFIPSVTETIASFAKITVLAIFAGYQAPTLINKMAKKSSEAILNRAEDG